METIKPGTLVEVGGSESAQAESPEVTALVTRAKSGDAEAFEGLMRLYERRVIALGIQMGLSRDEALDSCQDVFVKVFRYIRGFRTGRSFYKWLYRIAINAIYDQLRWSRPSGVTSVELIDEVQEGRLYASGPAPDAQAESADLARKLLGHLGCLSKQERIVFVLRDLQEMGTDEIGRILNLSQVTVRRHCMSARQKLRDRLLPTKRI
ncbi:MAG TPA: sigma-70 family RNA polymerase sigma factor [Candidatus Polarisedimenticolia bacterium]|nr:sigma-70 family RNA polymerase sigma factor [Candidatus Polarisedimenticolia bacterium]